MKSKSVKKVFAVLSAVLLAVLLMFPASGAGGVSELIPGGMAFGVKFFTSGALVLGTTGIETAVGLVSPAKDAGLRAKDVIIRAGGNEFESAGELIRMICGSGGKPVAIAYLRDGTESTVTITPARDRASGEYRIGVMVRDSTAGIGTVTYIEPGTNDFGGLGHGICDSETGTLLPLLYAAVVDVTIDDVVKSEKNSPGELKGTFGNIARGSLYANTEVGVFGRFTELPRGAGKPIPVASKEELSTGKAHILTTLSGDKIERYEVEIERVYELSGSTKNFLIAITDERLLSQAGGIVQGMSGSPIIKDGKLIGAVTHVLVNDPTHGYGIHIGNMLSESYGVSKQTALGSVAG